MDRAAKKELITTLNGVFKGTEVVVVAQYAGLNVPQMQNLRKQAEKFGARFAYSEVTDFEGHPDHIRIKADDEWLETRALIVASGASARWLGLENEEKLVGHGLTSCATCAKAIPT